MPCVFAKTCEETERCKSAFISIQENQGYKAEAIELSRFHKELETNFKQFREEIKHQFEAIGKYGLGKNSTYVRKVARFAKKFLKKPDDKTLLKSSSSALARSSSSRQRSSTTPVRRHASTCINAPG